MEGKIIVKRLEGSIDQGSSSRCTMYIMSVFKIPDGIIDEMHKRLLIVFGGEMQKKRILFDGHAGKTCVLVKFMVAWVFII